MEECPCRNYLLEIATILPTEFGAGTAEVVGAEVLDADLLR